MLAEGSRVVVMKHKYYSRRGSSAIAETPKPLSTIPQTPTQVWFAPSICPPWSEDSLALATSLSRFRAKCGQLAGRWVHLCMCYVLLSSSGECLAHSSFGPLASRPATFPHCEPANTAPTNNWKLSKAALSNPTKRSSAADPRELHIDTVVSERRSASIAIPPPCTSCCCMDRSPLAAMIRF